MEFLLEYSSSALSNRISLLVVLLFVICVCLWLVITMDELYNFGKIEIDIKNKEIIGRLEGNTFIFDLFNNLEKSKQDYVKKIFLNNLNDVKKFSTAFSHTKNFLPICRLKFIYYNNTILNINEFGDFYAY